MSYCKDCLHWKKLQELPFGTCQLPIVRGLDAEPARYEDGGKVQSFPPQALFLFMPDLASCSAFEKEAAE